MASDVRLTVYCAVTDVESVALALREAFQAPIHVRREEVYGREFGDAGTAELVKGQLQRVAIEVAVPGDKTEYCLEVLTSARRSMPIRWQMTPVLAQGRLV